MSFSLSFGRKPAALEPRMMMAVTVVGAVSLLDMQQQAEAVVPCP
jgi:hypothetical protein